MNCNIDSERSPCETTSPESENRRKRKKSIWTLSGRQTDKEVLQEMGVGILSQDNSEGDSPCDEVSQVKPKRKCNIENVNPNINCASAQAKVSPRRSPNSKKRSPGTSEKNILTQTLKYSPSPGPSRVRSPDDCAGRQQSEWVTNNQSMDEETPLPLIPVQLQYKLKQNVSNTSTENTGTLYTDDLDTQLNDTVLSNLRSNVEVGVDAFSSLSDEVMLGIFKWLSKVTLADCMLVCKRWHRIASDETFWQRLELGNKELLTGAIGKILERKPIIVRLAGSQIGEWSNSTDFEEPSRIQYLDLSICSISYNTLNSLLEKCPALKKLSLEFIKVNDQTCQLIARCHRMETLNLTMSEGVSPDGLLSILEGCRRLQSLNLSWCHFCLESLEVLCANVNPRIQRLNIAGAKHITDELLSALVTRCPRLLELDVSDCPRITDIICITKLNTLEHLALSRCYLLPPNMLTKLNCMSALQYLEVWGMLQATSLMALKQALPGIQINQFMHSAIARPTVGPRRTSIWGLRTRD